MLLACHKKSYLICDEITNFRIFMQLIPIFFSEYNTDTAQTGQRQLLEKKILHNISETRYFVTYQITLLMTCQPHKKKRKINVNFNVDFWCQINQSSTRTTKSYVFSWKWVTCRRFIENMNEWMSIMNQMNRAWLMCRGVIMRVFLMRPLDHLQKRHNFQEWLWIMWGLKKEKYITISPFRIKLGN